MSLTTTLWLLVEIWSALFVVSSLNYQYSLSKQRKHCAVVLSNNTVKWSPFRQWVAPPIIRPYAVWKQWEYKEHLFLSLAYYWGNSKHSDSRQFSFWLCKQSRTMIQYDILAKKVRLVAKGFYRQKPWKKIFTLLKNIFLVLLRNSKPKQWSEEPVM